MKNPATILALTLNLFLSLNLIFTLQVLGDEPSVPDGFQLLFNGKNSEGWSGNNPHQTAKASAEKRAEALAKQQPEFKAHWSVENGELVNDGHGPYATTSKEYGDIELVVDYKTVAKADSGIYLRGTPQVQIWDYTEAGGKWGRGADKGSGGLFNNRPESPGKNPAVLADKPFGEWNRFHITQLGSRTSVKLNDKLVVDNLVMENFWDKSRATPLAARGPIHLQTHGGEIRWRNVAVREVPAEEANRRLRGDDKKAGFRPSFRPSLTAKISLAGKAPSTTTKSATAVSFVVRGKAECFSPRRNTKTLWFEWNLSCQLAGTMAWRFAIRGRDGQHTTGCVSCRCWTTIRIVTPNSTRDNITARRTEWCQLIAATSAPQVSGITKR
jgi:hypothetical protein